MGSRGTTHLAVNVFGQGLVASRLFGAVIGQSGDRPERRSGPYFLSHGRAEANHDEWANPRHLTAYPDAYGAWPGSPGLCWQCPAPMMPGLVDQHANAPPESEGTTHVQEDESQGGALASSGSNGSSVGASPIIYPSTWRTVSGGGCLQVKSRVSAFLSRSF